MKLSKILLYLLGSFLLFGCSGGLETNAIDEGIVTLRLINAASGNLTGDVSAASPGTLQATVTDVNGNPIVGLVVSFYTNERGIPYPGAALTGSNGVASVGLFAGSVPGADTAYARITTSAGNFSAAVGFYTKGDQPKTKLISLALESTELELGADTTITATVTYEDGEPVPNSSVSFSTTLGSVYPAAAATASDGIALSTLNAGYVAGRGLARASVSGATASANFSVAYETRTILISLVLESIELELGANTLMTATVAYDDGTPITNTNVTFSTTMGSVSPATATTDSGGIAISTLNAGEVEGTGIATASVSGATKSTNFTVDTQTDDETEEDEDEPEYESESAPVTPTPESQSDSASKIGITD
ncbi:Ig-like domain-containing protein [Desulfococcaceae bacterium HSG9]|nr:Ig-like domain-containing protein [Desulfococcaceae bacterium HSG9]